MDGWIWMMGRSWYCTVLVAGVMLVESVYFIVIEQWKFIYCELTYSRTINYWFSVCCFPVNIKFGPLCWNNRGGSGYPFVLLHPEQRRVTQLLPIERPLLWERFTMFNPSQREFNRRWRGYQTHIHRRQTVKREFRNYWMWINPFLLSYHYPKLLIDKYSLLGHTGRL